MPLIRKGPDEGAPLGAERRSAADDLTAGTSQERWAAARALASTPQGVTALAHALRTEEDPRVREAIFTGLARIGTDDSVRAVLPYLRSDDANLRTGVLDALRAMPEVVAPHLADLLDDDDPDVRLLACEIARGLPDAKATELLCALLDREQQVNICAAAIEVLAEVGATEALPALARCAGRFPDEAFLGFSIRIATERIGADPSGRRG